MTKLCVLQRLGDVAGVVGSFVSDSDGEFLFASMPGEFGEPELRRTTSRLASIVRCATSCGLDAESCDLSCDLNVGPCRLLASRFPGGTLCVLMEPRASRRAVRMAMQLASSELVGLLEPGWPKQGAVDVVDGEEDEATTRYSAQ